MKTSNKLLIALAALFFIIPLTALVYSSRDYVDTKDPRATRQEPKKFDEAFKGYSGTVLNNFNAISIADGKGLHFNIKFINDAKSGVKINDNFKDVFKFSVNAAGTLEITVLKKPEETNYLTLYIYAAALNKVTIAGAGGLNLPGKFDVFEINAKNMDDLHLGEESTFNKLSVNADKVEDFSLWGANISSLNLVLNNTSFKSNETSYHSLIINAAGKGDIELENESDKKTAEIDSLLLTASGKGNIYIKNVSIAHVAGSLSDSTMVTMPVPYLRQLIKP